MTLGDLRAWVSRQKPYLDDCPLEIVVHRPGSVGPTPTVPVRSVTCGFDWDNNKVLVLAEAAGLEVLTSDQVEADIREVRQRSTLSGYRKWQQSKHASDEGESK